MKFIGKYVIVSNKCSKNVNLNVVNASMAYINRTDTLVTGCNNPIIHLEFSGELVITDDLQNCISKELLRHSEFLTDNMLTYELKSLYRSTIMQQGLYLTPCDAVELLIEYLYSRYGCSVVILDYSKNISKSDEVIEEIKSIIDLVSKSNKVAANFIVYNR